MFRIIAIASAIGTLISIYLSHHFYALRQGTADFKSLCQIGSFNCDAIAASRWAELGLGIPLSSLGAGWYLSLTIIALLGLSASWRAASARVLFPLSLAGVALSGAYLVIMVGVLKQLCLFCLILDAIAAIIFVLALKLRGEKAPAGVGQGEFTLQRKQLFKTLGFATAITVGLLHLFMGVGEKSPIDAKQAASSILAGPQATLDLTNSPSLGAPDAVVTIVEFSDYQCPYCKMGAKLLHSLQHRFAGKVRIVFKNFPLDGACNPSVTQGGHSAACEAARVSHCAHLAGKWEPVYIALFDRQEDLKSTRPAEIAKEAGLPESALATCLDAASTREKISADISDGQRNGVPATPTFFINGYKMEGLYPTPVWVELIERLIESSKNKN